MLKIIAALIVLIGVTCIYDARRLTKKLFSFGDQNEGSMGMKITGFIFCAIGAIMLLLS